MAEKLEPYCEYLAFYKQLGLQLYMQSQIVINGGVLFQAAILLKDRDELKQVS